MNTEETIEDLVFDFLEERIAAAASDDALAGQELHDTIFKTLKKSSGVRIGDAESSLAPNVGQELQEFDAVLTLVCYARIEGKDKTQRRAARRKAFQISKAVARLFLDDPQMGERVCDSKVLAITRGWDSINSQPYAVVNMPIVFNESGAIDFERRR